MLTRRAFLGRLLSAADLAVAAQADILPKLVAQIDAPAPEPCTSLQWADFDHTVGVLSWATPVTPGKRTLLASYTPDKPIEIYDVAAGCENVDFASDRWMKFRLMRNDTSTLWGVSLSWRAAFRWVLDPCEPVTFRAGEPVKAFGDTESPGILSCGAITFRYFDPDRPRPVRLLPPQTDDDDEPDEYDSWVE